MNQQIIDKQAEYNAVQQEERAIKDILAGHQREYERLLKFIAETVETLDALRSMLHAEPQYRCPVCSTGLVVDGDEEAGDSVLTVWPEITEGELAQARQARDAHRVILKDAAAQRDLVKRRIDESNKQWYPVHVELMRIGQEMYSLGPGTGGQAHGQ